MPICEKCGKDLPSEKGLKVHVAFCGKDRKRIKGKKTDVVASTAEPTQLDVAIQASVLKSRAQGSWNKEDDLIKEAEAQEAATQEFAEPKVEPVAVKVEPKAEPANLAGLPQNFTPEIPVGTKLLLNSTVWCKPPTGSVYAPAPAVNLVVRVVSKQAVEKGNWLFCQADGSDVLWAVVENDVFQGVYKILELAAPAMPPMVSNVEDRAKKAKELEDFRAALVNYVDARDKKLEAEKIYKKVDKAERPIIWTYVEKNGRESAEGKQDFVVEDSGYKVHLERTPGGFRTEYESEAIVDWLVKNNHQDCIKMVPNFDMWKGLKEAGKVPPQIIAAVETPVEYKDTFALKIRELKEDSTKIEPEFKKE